jgi:hypothetical protein
MAQAKTSSGVANQSIAPANVSAAEAVTVTATSVSDSSKAAFIHVTVNPALALVNLPPPQPQPGVVGGVFSYNLANFVQGETAPFTLAIKSGTLAAGLVLDAKTGMITGTPMRPCTRLLSCTSSAPRVECKRPFSVHSVYSNTAMLGMNMAQCKPVSCVIDLGPHFRKCQ